VQRELTALRLARGDRVIGWKLGYTSLAMREQMGIAEPNHGPLLASMLVRDIPASFVQPRVEPEIALVLDRDPGPGADVDGVLAACSHAVAALEVVDSVWRDYVFDLEHNTADGSSAAAVVLGEELPLDSLEDVAVTLSVDGVVVGTGAAGVAWLADRLAERGLALAPGDVVITGGLTAAYAIEPGGVVAAAFAHPGFEEVKVEVRR